MNNDALRRGFADLATPLVADACMRVGTRVRFAPPGIHPMHISHRLAGWVLPVRHYGSVDIFLKAISTAEPGDVLVIDNAGRLDEGCIGDLVALEAQAAQVAGLVLWGACRDSSEIAEIGLPVFAYGTCPAGPQRLDPAPGDALDSAQFGDHKLSRDDVVFADLDGVLFVSAAQMADVLVEAHSIRRRERAQADAIREGHTLREQLRFDEYWDKHTLDSAYTFRRHLETLGGAIEV